MNWLQNYIVQNFVLVCVCSVLLIYAIQRYKQHKRISFYSILIVSLALVMSVVDLLQEYCKASGYLEGTFVCSLFGYSFRPVYVFLFILMSSKPKSWKFMLLTAIPLFANFVIYLLGIFPGVQEYVVHFFRNGDGTISWSGGQGVLRFASHVVSLGYLVWLIFISLAMLKFKHISHGITILLCAIFVIAAVVIESFFDSNDDIYLLNTTTAVCAMFYYLYLYIEKSQVDTLTNLFNRETYYHDVEKMDKSITGVIQFDMNGLKYINDNYGHHEGDKALSEIANMILKSSTRKMYAYRLGGDEFLILAIDSDEKAIIETVNRFKESISLTSYHCSIGYSYRNNKNQPIDDLLKDAEVKMYKDKAEFYKNSNIERRKV